MSSSAARTRAPRTRVRWDRLGRIGMLIVLSALLYLWIRPALTLLSSEQSAAHQRAQLESLERENTALRARRSLLERPAEIMLQARELGMVMPGERQYVITGLPGN
jgi:cell division protein FtsB